MVSGFICGTNSLPRDDDDHGEYERHTRSADSSPRKSRSKDKNPYSKRGLDKFSALLEELEEKRQQIYSKVVNPDEISLVRFTYADDHEFKPIVIKAKHKGVTISTQRLDKQTVKSLNKLASSSEIVVANTSKNDVHKVVLPKTRTIKPRFYGKFKIEPRFYLPVICIGILVILVVFGRSFAIMCTSIGWYVIPTIANNSKSCSSSKVSFKKKDYAMRRLSEKKLTVSSEGSFNRRNV